MRWPRKISYFAAWSLSGLALYALLPGGCPPSNPTPSGTTAEAVPELAAEEVGVDSAIPTPLPIDSRVPIQDKQPTAVHIQATVPCEDGGTRAADFNVVFGPGSKSIVTDDSVFLSSGWAFLWGHYPWIQTSRASAGAEGSEILVRVQVNPDGTTTETFFHVEGHTWAVSGHHLPCNPDSWTDDDEYGLLTPTGDLPTLVPLVVGSPDQVFRDQAVTTARNYAGQIGLEAP